MWGDQVKHLGGLKMKNILKRIGGFVVGLMFLAGRFQHRQTRSRVITIIGMPGACPSIAVIDSTITLSGIDTAGPTAMGDTFAFAPSD